MIDEQTEQPEVASETPLEAPTDATAEPETYSADYVRELRAEAAERRMKAKKIDVANERLVHAYAAQDGRLVDVGELAFDPGLLDDDGLVDPDKVKDAISALLTLKPYLTSARPLQPITQGVRADIPESPGLFALLRERL
jgi:hypothetical protein